MALVLSRRLTQGIVLDENIIVRVVRVSGKTVRLSIDAPSSIGIRREELRPREPKK